MWFGVPCYLPCMFMCLQVPDLELSEITDVKDYPKVVHGTSIKAWDTIKKEVIV